MTNDEGRKPEGAPERSPKAGEGAPSGVDGNSPKRFSVQRKMAIVARLLRGEPLDLVARQTNVSVARLTDWRDRALAGAATALKERERDDRDDEIARRAPPHRVRLPAGASYDVGNRRPARSAQQPQHPRLLGICARSVMARDLAAGRLRSDLPGRLRLAGARTLALGHAKLLSVVSAQHRAVPPKPRGGPAALAGERSEPVRLRVRDHHACSV